MLYSEEKLEKRRIILGLPIKAMLTTLINETFIHRLFRVLMTFIKLPKQESTVYMWYLVCSEGLKYALLAYANEIKAHVS